MKGTFPLGKESQKFWLQPVFGLANATLTVPAGSAMVFFSLRFTSTDAVSLMRLACDSFGEDSEACIA